MSLTKPNFQLIANASPKSPLSEAYKILRTNIEFSNLDERIGTIGITSSKRGEGKSLTSANLAIAYAQTNKRVLLIDADLRSPVQHHLFGMSNRVGLTSLLSHQEELDDVLQVGQIPNLTVLPSGPIPPDPSEMLASKRLAPLMKDLKLRFETIIIDTPPVLGLPDAQLMAAHCDGVILVVHSGKVKKETALKAKASLQLVKTKLLGVALNNINRNSAEDYYYYHYGERR